ncbi:MAG: translation elongation factor Ts [Gaiellaceae bacterium]
MSQIEIPAALVKELRDLTGAGMMDCKRALAETSGDVVAARRLLRERGMAQATKRAGRETTEGIVLLRIADGRGAMVAVGCESEPVSGNEEFRRFAQSVLDAVEVEGSQAAESFEAERVELVGRIGENIVLRGAERYEQGDGELVGGYVHPPANKIGVLVKLAGGGEELARLVAMHVSFANPRFRSRDEIPAEIVAEERDVYMKQPELQSKPEQVREKIVEGMLQKRFFAEQVLDDQAWIHEPGKTVGQVLEAEHAAVVAFRRFALSE